MSNHEESAVANSLTTLIAKHRRDSRPNRRPMNASHHAKQSYSIQDYLPPPPPPEGEINSRRNLANFALSTPKWYEVALFFWVRAISASISAIFSCVVDIFLIIFARYIQRCEKYPSEDCRRVAQFFPFREYFRTPDWGAQELPGQDGCLGGGRGGHD